MTTTTAMTPANQAALDAAITVLEARYADGSRGYPEERIEDWICENVQSLPGLQKATAVGRQLEVPGGGILDVLALRSAGPMVWIVTVIELKAVTASELAVTQALEYKAALESIEDDLSRWIHEKAPGPLPCLDFECVVAAPGITDRAAAAVAAVGRQHIRFIQLDLDGDGVPVRATEPPGWRPSKDPRDPLALPMAMSFGARANGWGWGKVMGL